MKRSKQRHALRPPPKPDFSPPVEMQVINTDIAFDENERKKFDALAEPFLSESVSNLPQTLEETINNYHNKNAESLVLNKLDLENAKIKLSQILEKLNVSLESAIITRNNERIVSEKLRSIDLNSDKDATVVVNKQEASKLLTQIAEDASVPPEWEALIGHPRFSAIQNLPHLYEVLMKLTEEVESENIPPSLVGLRVAKERVESFKNLSETFSNAFLTFINRTFSKVDIVQAFATKAPLAEYIPPDENEEEDDDSHKKKMKKYSIPSVSEHPLLKVANLYWKFICWEKIHYYEDCYLQLQKIYINCSNAYFLKHTGERFIKNIAMLQSSTRPKPVPTDPFATDDEYSDPHSQLFVHNINRFLSDFFNGINAEACILSEFWKITDPSTLGQIITKPTIESVKAFMEAVKLFDPLFLIIAYRLCANADKNSIVPLDEIVAVPRSAWQNHLKKMFAEVRSSKAPKTVCVIQVFKDLPKFFKTLTGITPENDLDIFEKTICVIIEELVTILTEEIALKLPKKNMVSRTVVMNMAFLFERMRTMDIISKSKAISSKMLSIQHLLKTNIDIFLEQMTAKIWPDAFSFFNQVEEWMKQDGFTYEIVTFQVSHTEEKFKDLNEKIDKKIVASVGECFNFLRKKIPSESLRRELKKSVVVNIQELFQKWSNIAYQCYGIKLTTTPEKVVQLMKDSPKV
ncbi:hypothetical protein TRFO_07381 [Tritrichomonas foetus]|uniref:Uncharacterized protein n=1 Tax=Tritrichomonas foetus TaxID=1144522 RepID=A0A1J4JS01_9EUKA|nr:hypothetical protein TRFO_07381 [Tritrichomonas foetus]|eukprot:OHT01819.1 hypothetical protein TRFO_07381 [Tritrichomonas foetus]